MAATTGRDTSPLIYESLAERLRGFILEGKFAPGDMLGSEHELARRESISRMTVRKASEVLIRDGLIERRPGKGLFVRAIVRRALLGSAPVAVVGNMLWDTSLEMARGVQLAAKSADAAVQLYDAHGEHEQDFRILDDLPRSGALGAIVVSSHSPEFSKSICKLHLADFPFVLLDQRMHDIDVSSVTSDNHAGGVAAGEYLLAMGHRRIAFIGDLIAVTVRDRLSGLRDALADAGVAHPRSLVIDLTVGADHRGDWAQRIKAGLHQLLGETTRPTAIFCSCDAVARHVYRTLESVGLRVPEDISIVGYDDDPLAEFLHPKLTTIRQPFRELGQAAMQLLMKRVTDPTAEPEHRKLPITLIERESVGEVNEGS